MAEALQAVRTISPELVVPCYYNCPAFFSRKYNPADEMIFKEEVGKRGAKCTILHNRESIVI